MSEKEKKVLESLTEILPNLPPFEKGRLLGYGERMAEEKAQREKEDKHGTDAVI